MLKAIPITIENKPLIKEVNNGLVPYNDETIRTLMGKVYFIHVENALRHLVVPAKAFKRRFKFVTPEITNQFVEVIKR